MTDFNHLNDEQFNEQTDPVDAVVDRVEKVVAEAEANAAEAQNAEAVEQAAQTAEADGRASEQGAQPNGEQAQAAQTAYENPSAPRQPNYYQPPRYNNPQNGQQPRYSSQNGQYNNNQQYQGQYRPPYNGAPYDNRQPQYNPYIPRPVPQGYVQKNRILAGIFGILFGGIGLHNFYLGFTTRAVIQIVVSIVTCGIGSLWGFIEGIMIVAGYYNNNCDANGIPTKEM